MSTTKAFSKPTVSGAMRLCDVHGCGSFGSDRTGHAHQGEDYKTTVGEDILSPISGRVTRFPFPYGSDLRYKGIEIKNDKYSVKIFYMQATVRIGDMVTAGQKVGFAQDIAAKYSPGMTNHVHVEVRDISGNLLQLSKLI